MKFASKPEPEINPNISGEHPVREFLRLLGLFVFTGIFILAVLGIITESVANLIPKSWERKVFGNGPAPQNLTNKPVAAYIQSVLEKLKAQEHDPVYNTQVKIDCETQPNAYAVPGGTIWVTAGLAKTVRTENGLAFVLAHEMGHFQNRDPLRGIFRGVVFAFFNGLVGGRGDPNFLLSSVVGLTFDRNQERRADSHALYLVKKTYGHVKGAEEFFEAIERQGLSDDSIPTLAKTHPSSVERLEQVKEWEKMGSGKAQILPPLPPWTTECEKGRAPRF